jgi:diaminopimelate decarboxylase
VDQPFWYKKREMYCEDVPVAEIARKCGTPFYLYSQSALVRQYRAFDEAFAPVPHLTCYAVKANSNLPSCRFSALWAPDSMSCPEAS